MQLLPVVYIRKSVTVTSPLRTKKFPRWMRGSCIEAPPQTVPGQDEPVKYTFFTDVSLHHEVNELGLHIHETVHCGISQLVAHTSTWKKFKLLWRMNRVFPLTTPFKPYFTWP